MELTANLNDTRTSESLLNGKNINMEENFEGATGFKGTAKTWEFKSQQEEEEEEEREETEQWWY